MFGQIFLACQLPLTQQTRHLRLVDKHALVNDYIIVIQWIIGDEANTT